MQYCETGFHSSQYATKQAGTRGGSPIQPQLPGIVKHPRATSKARTAPGKPAKPRTNGPGGLGSFLQKIKYFSLPSPGRVVGGDYLSRDMRE